MMFPDFERENKKKGRSEGKKKQDASPPFQAKIKKKTEADHAGAANKEDDKGRGNFRHILPERKGKMI
jgi:hypothetical protein